MSTTTLAPPRQNMAALVVHLINAGVELERLERHRDELTHPGEYVGVFDLRRMYDTVLGKARHVLETFAPTERELVEGPGRDSDTLPSPSLTTTGAPEHPDLVGCPGLEIGQVWLSCYANDRWKVEHTDARPGEGTRVLLRALDGAHEGKTVLVDVGRVREQALLLRAGEGGPA